MMTAVRPLLGQITSSSRIIVGVDCMAADVNAGFSSGVVNLEFFECIDSAGSAGLTVRPSPSISTGCAVSTGAPIVEDAQYRNRSKEEENDAGRERREENEGEVEEFQLEGRLERVLN